MDAADDTPRSYGSPRDDRFHTPRAFARSNSSNSDEWQTPRTNAVINSDNEYQTPRMYEADWKQRASITTTAGSKGTGHLAHIPTGRTPDNKSRQQHLQQQAILGNGAYNYGSGAKHVGNVQYQAGQYEDDAVTSDLVASQINSGVFSEEDLENLFRFARHGRCEEIDSLFTRGIPVDTKDSFGNTVLTTACQNGNKRVAKTALRRGANINARNHKGNTPLHYCYHYGYGDTLGEYLISKGADPNTRNNAGKKCSEGI